MKVIRLSNNELYHHGIKGQKWGVQNGPPYPLDQKHELKTIRKITSKRETMWETYNSKYRKKSKAIKAITSDEKVQNFVKSALDSHYKIRDELEKDFKKNIKKYESHFHKTITDHLDDDDEKYLLKHNKSYLHESMEEEMAYNDSYTDYIYRDIIKSNKSKYKPLVNNYKLSVNLYADYLNDCADNITGKYADTPIKRVGLTDKAETYKDFVIETADQDLGWVLYHTSNDHKLYWEKGLVD